LESQNKPRSYAGTNERLPLSAAYLEYHGAQAYIESQRMKRSEDATVVKAPKPRRKSVTRQAKKADVRTEPREAPANGKARDTYEKLVAAAGQLLAEVGFERLSTNAICARARMTPPAFYNYFSDKYQILEVLARRLLKRQNDAYAIWLFEAGSWVSSEKRAGALEQWYRIAADIVASEPGGFWTMRALRALPGLSHIRVESQRMLTDHLFEFYRRAFPHMDPQLLWCRIRLRMEFGWVVDELALEEDRLPHELLFREAARLMSKNMDEEFPPPG
jgi:AcrR family transcriptional regulator